MVQPISSCLVCLIAILAASGLAGDVASTALLSSQDILDAILTDQVELEDFEGFSLVGGGSLGSPNPFSSSTADSHWKIASGVTYRSPTSLTFYASSLFADDSNVLSGGPTIEFEFDEPQRAIGFYKKNITCGGTDYHNTISFFRGPLLVGEVSYVLPPTEARFWGWKNAVGITSMQVASADYWGIIDNIQWGIPANLQPPDLALWASSYGVNDAADVDFDGDTDGADFLILQRSVLAGEGNLTSVPEPGGACIAFCIGVFCWRAPRLDCEVPKCSQLGRSELSVDVYENQQFKVQGDH